MKKEDPKEIKSCPFCGAVGKYQKSYKWYLIIHEDDCFFTKINEKETIFKISKRQNDVFKLLSWNKRIKNKIQITKEEQEKILKYMLKQRLQISKQITLKTFWSIYVKCYDCGRSIGMINMYRCFQCGLYICGNCAPKHFNIDKSKLPKYIEDKK